MKASNKLKRAGAIGVGLLAAPAAGLALAAPAQAPEAGEAPALLPKLGALPEPPPLVARPPHRSAFPVEGDVRDGAGEGAYGADRGGRMHEGQDVFAPAGTPLVALRDGKVVEKGDDGGRGNYIAVHSPSLDRTWLYLHMQSPTRFAVGDRVQGGQRVGAVGCTGSCFGDHLHIELRKGASTTGAPTDPRPILDTLRQP